MDPSHGPRQVAALGSSPDSLRLIRRGPAAMKAPQYQIVAVNGLIETEEQYQVSLVDIIVYLISNLGIISKLFLCRKLHQQKTFQFFHFIFIF